MAILFIQIYRKILKFTIPKVFEYTLQNTIENTTQSNVSFPCNGDEIFNYKDYFCVTFLNYISV